MKISAFEFRFQNLIYASIFALGFLAPWDRWLHLDHGRTSWLLLASTVGRIAWLPFNTATVGLLLAAILLAFAAAALRTWASAFLDASKLQDSVMHGNALISDGPYRCIRNPLYLGTVLHAVALSLLMPPTGAVFTLLLVGVFQLRLIAAEEAFLKQMVGAPYVLYCDEVPSFLPSWRSGVAAAHTRPDWGRGFLGEIYMWGVAISFTILGWRYNALLILQGVLVSLGLSLVIRALLPARRSERPVA